MYEWPPSAAPRYAYREVHLACGDHSPARVALLTRRGVRMDPDGLRPAAGVEMRPNSGIDSPPGDFEPRGFIAIADMRAAAERQPLSDRALAPALQHANHQVIWGIFAVAALGALLALVYRRRVIR